MENIRFIYYTNEKNVELCELALKHFFKHNKNENLKVTVLSNKFNSDDFKYKDKVEYLSSNIDFFAPNRFVETMKFGLNRIKEDYVFLFLDDYFFLDEIKYDDLSRVLNLMNCDGVDYFGFDLIPFGSPEFKLFKKFTSKCENKFDEVLLERPFEFQYLYSVQPCVWKKNSLIKLFERCENISLHDLDNTIELIKKETEDFFGLGNTLYSTFDYDDAFKHKENYFIISYTEIVRSGVFNIPENGMPIGPLQPMVQFIYKLIEEENLNNNLNFGHLLNNFKFRNGLEINENTTHYEIYDNVLKNKKNNNED
jgi:hypothetical protein